jgi:hypothetical protein
MNNEILITNWWEVGNTKLKLNLIVIEKTNN